MNSCYRLMMRIRSLQEDLQESRQEAEKAQKQADKYQKRMNELAPMVKEHGKAGGRLFRRSGADASRSGGYGICKVVSGKESKTAGKENCTSYALRLFGISGYFQISLQSRKRRITGNGAETSD